VLGLTEASHALVSVTSGEAAVFAVLRTVAVVSWPGVSALLAWLVTPVALPEPPSWAPPAAVPDLRGPQEALLSAASRRGPPVLAWAC
jgi:hypothetical protein